MSKDKKDILDELFRSKLYDFEVDTSPEDWDAISDRLSEPAPTIRPLRRSLYRWSVAAVLAILMTTGTVYMIKTGPSVPEIAEQIQQEREIIESPQREEIIIPQTIDSEQPPVLAITQTPTTLSYSENIQISSVEIIEEKENIIISENQEIVYQEEKEPIVQESSIVEVDLPNLVSDNKTQKRKKESPRQKKWGFGMGGGSLSTGSENTVNMLTFRDSSVEEDEEANFANAVKAPVNLSNVPKTNVKHKTPVSVGFAVSRYLNDRWALQTGLSYSMLTSNWEQVAEYYSKTRRRLHYLGVPVSASYKIAEWNGINVYAAGGALVEYNIAGKMRIEHYSGDELWNVETLSPDMDKKWFFSLNTRAGISYPIIRYVNAFAEVGGSYYFDNNSTVETIHSEKPFNVSFNFGLRLGF